MELKLEGKIFGSLEPNYISIHVGFTRGIIDGGYLWSVKREIIPLESRIPNSLVWVTIKNAEIILIEKMSRKEELNFRS